MVFSGRVADVGMMIIVIICFGAFFYEVIKEVVWGRENE